MGAFFNGFYDLFMCGSGVRWRSREGYFFLRTGVLPLPYHEGAKMHLSWDIYMEGDDIGMPLREGSRTSLAMTLGPAVCFSLLVLESELRYLPFLLAIVASCK